MNINKDNYFTSDNKYLSNSKIKDWLKDKRYFYQRHIAHSKEFMPTLPMIIGSAVDIWLTESRERFEELYVPVARRNLKNPPIGYTEITQSDYNMIVGMCEHIENQDAYKELRQHQAQQILQYEMDLNHFQGLCGIPDWFKMEGTHAIITDLKTARTVNPKKYYYNAMDLGYFRQQAMYQLLLANTHGAKTFESRHIAVEKDTQGIYKVEVFILDQQHIDSEKIELQDILHSIKSEKHFAKCNVHWDNAITIGELI